MLIMSNVLSASPKLYLYLLPFENINNEQVIAWLGSGFTDMLTKELTSIDGLFLRNRDDLENIMNNRSLLLKQPRDSRNILALGKFSRKMDEITVDMQFIDIANWDEQKVLKSQVDIYKTVTFYKRYGDYLGRLSSFISSIFILMIFVKSKIQ